MERQLFVDNNVSAMAETSSNEINGASFTMGDIDDDDDFSINSCRWRRPKKIIDDLPAHVISDISKLEKDDKEH